MKVKPADLEIGMKVPVADPNLGVQWRTVLAVHRQYDQSTRWRIDLEDLITGGKSIYVHTDQEIEVQT